MKFTLVTAALAIVGTLLGSIVSGRFQERAAERSVRISLGREPSPPGVTAGAVYAASSTHREPRRVARDNRGYPPPIVFVWELAQATNCALHLATAPVTALTHGCSD
ncbi:hypothetical protein ACF09I_31320 [Streptomyces sp. NPDC014940]|uniref:hypothetical protein n=1 Tax=Streptomyces sp. NPDC014940 TaxID=3364932 RepID=UPI0036FBDBCB